MEYMIPEDTAKVAGLIWEVFSEFEAPGYKQEGIDEFREFIEPKNMLARCQYGCYYFICYKYLGEIVGTISVMYNRHISLLFVKKEYHRRGIARKLLDFALKVTSRAEKKVTAITVNSSPYAVEIYEKMGFEKTNIEQEKNGIKFTPMKREIPR